MSINQGKRDLDALLGLYNTAIIDRNTDLLLQHLARPIPDSIRQHPSLHGRIRRSRGNAFCRIEQVDEGEREYELGFYETPADDKGEYLLDWSMASFQRMFTSADTSDKTAAGQRCLEILGLVDGFTCPPGDAPYLGASVSSIRAFVMVFLGDDEGARRELASITLPLLPRVYREQDRLASFFTQVPKGMVAALELKDAGMIRTLASSLVTEQERAFLHGRPSTAGIQLLFVLGNRASDVPKFSDSWRALVENAHLLFPRYKVLRRFRTLINQDAVPIELARFIDEVCGE